MASNNPTPTITLQSPIAEFMKYAVSERQSKSVARFDFGNGREVAFICITEDVDGFLGVIQAYEDGRDQYAAKVANAVAEDIAKNGLPEKGQSFNLIKSDGIAGTGEVPAIEVDGNA